MKYFSYCVLLAGLFIFFKVKAQSSLSYNRGHSHNDYRQHVPLFSAYNAVMGSIEADVFLRKGELFVAHDTSEININATLKRLYLEPLAGLYRKNGNQVYQDSSLKLQLVIDIKQNYRDVIPKLMEHLSSYGVVFDSSVNPKAIKIILSGDMPDPAEFKNYPDYISFDGRPRMVYTSEQLKRVAMISDNLKSYTSWDGRGKPAKDEENKLRTVIEKAHQLQKPFRFWASKDNPDTWIVLEKLGADWINTDHPMQLREFYLRKDSYRSPAIR